MKKTCVIGLPLKAERLNDGTRDVLRDIAFLIDDTVYLVSKGFNTDFSSIPSEFTWIVRWSRVDLAGTLHDELYGSQRVSRREADRIWRIVAQSGPVSANAVQAWVCWLGLRIGGWTRWGKKSHEQIESQS